MISLVETTGENKEIELEIMNSNPEYNLISSNKEKLTLQDIEEEYIQTANIQSQRLLIKKDNDYIGIIDYCMSNPSDLKPWVGLLILHKDYQKNGYAKDSYLLFEKTLQDRGIKQLRLGVISNNERALQFWTRSGFKKYTETYLEEKIIYCFEKEI